MKSRFLILLPFGMLLAACSTHTPMVHDGRSEVEYYGSKSPMDGSPITGTAAAPTDASRLVTGGLRSGSGAISRNNIDAVLNKPGAPPARSGSPKLKVKPAQERPGLATGYGESVPSPWNRQDFARASASPAGKDMIYYNDEEGVDAMSANRSRINGARRVAGETLEWGIKGRFGYLPAYSNYYQGSFIIGQKDASYSIVLKNRCKSRLEAVLSVDGLDVIDGKTAATSKRGYVLAPGETLEVKGWRTSPDTVARFRFSSVVGSYANLAHGETRNVGVIGLAVFTEKGVDPWTWMPDEIKVRETASPFAKSP